MDLQVTRSNEAVDTEVLTVVGAVDMQSRDLLTSAAIAALRGSQCRTLVLDLGGVTFIDSTGVGALVELSNLTAEHGDQQVIVRNPSQRVDRILTVTGLTETFYA